VNRLQCGGIAATLFGLLCTAAAPAKAPERSGPTLTRLARVAELYRDTALSFSCQEQIEYRGKSTGRIQFAYLFIHDDDGKFRDYRTWRTGTTASAKGEEVDPANYHVPRFLQSAYLWAFIFRADRQPHHAFFNLGEDTVLGRPALKIGFQPKGTILKGWNDWTGIASIDRETSQILRVEAWSRALEQQGQARRRPRRSTQARSTLGERALRHRNDRHRLHGGEGRHALPRQGDDRALGVNRARRSARMAHA